MNYFFPVRFNYCNSVLCNQKSPFVAVNVDGCSKSLVIMVIVQFNPTAIIRV